MPVLQRIKFCQVERVGLVAGIELQRPLVGGRRFRRFVLGHQRESEQAVSGSKSGIQFRQPQRRLLHFLSIGILSLAQEHGLVIVELPVFWILHCCLVQMGHRCIEVMAVEIGVSQAAMSREIAGILLENVLKFTNALVFVVVLMQMNVGKDGGGLDLRN